jgi:Polysaccharide deacetylase
MRLDKVLRFVTIAFAVGAFVGLICGLAFGGANDAGTSTPTSASEGDGPATSAAGSQTEATTGEPITADKAEAMGANELGQVLVLVYSEVGSEEDESTRTPDNFRDDLALLESEGFYPIDVRDLITGDMDIPAGRSPVVITFDGSSPGQYRILDDGSIDPDCAVGILQEAAEREDWAPRASFFCLTDVVPSDNEIFGQPEVQREKLRNLVSWGYEVGSNTAGKLDLSKASTEEAAQELAESQATLQDLIGNDYPVSSLALPYGSYPESDDILTAGQFEDLAYAYTAAVGLGGIPAPSPFSTDFEPLRIPRIVVTGDNLKDAIDAFKDHPELRYISDGDATSVSAPSDLPSDLGQPREGLGRPLIQY